MKYKLIFLLAILSFFFAKNANAEFVKTENIYNLCKSKSIYERSTCFVYVMGLFDGIALYKHCLTSIGDVSASQLSEIFTQYVKKNPKSWNITANDIFFNALYDSYNGEIKRCEDFYKNLDKNLK